jgi:hypothetical protein
MNPARLVDMKDLPDGMKYHIISITQFHGETALVHLEDRGDCVYTMWPVCPFTSKDVITINTGRIKCTMACRGHQRNVLSVILDKEDVSA